MIVEDYIQEVAELIVIAGVIMMKRLLRQGNILLSLLRRMSEVISMSYLWWNFEDISFCDVKELPMDCASVVNNQGYLITKDVFKIPIGINLKVY